MRLLPFPLLLSLLFLSCSPVPPSLQNGDLLFVGMPPDELGGGMASAISDATGSGALSYYHAAIVEVAEDGFPWVIDASPETGVSRQTLEVFLQRARRTDGCMPTIEVMRLKDTSNTADFIVRSAQFIGEPYDSLFLPDNGMHYCTELIYDSYTRKGRPLFPARPMNFKDSSGEFPQYWADLFRGTGHSIPQGLPGTNPQDMHDSPLLLQTGIRISLDGKGHAIIEHCD